MDITSAQYFSFGGENVCIKANIDGVVMDIPINPANRHWVAIQAWVAEGNTIAEAD